MWFCFVAFFGQHKPWGKSTHHKSWHLVLGWLCLFLCDLRHVTEPPSIWLDCVSPKPQGSLAGPSTHPHSTNSAFINQCSVASYKWPPASCLPTQTAKFYGLGPLWAGWQLAEQKTGAYPPRAIKHQPCCFLCTGIHLRLNLLEKQNSHQTNQPNVLGQNKVLGCCHLFKNKTERQRAYCR